MIFAALAGVLAAAAAGCGAEPDGSTQRLGAATVTPAFVQVNSAVPQTAQTIVTVPFNGAQTAGNLVVVIVGWNNTTSNVSSVADSKGNTYQLAIGPTRRGTVLSQSIYYAKNIAAAAAGTNAVTVTFSASTAFPDVRVLEYSGIDPTNPVDVSVAGTGTNATTSSGAVTTTNAADLLVAGNTVATHTTAAGANFTSRVITNPDGDIAEDRVVALAGSYSATAPLSSAGAWVMQMVAFRAASTAPDTQAPTAPASLTATAVSPTQINLAWPAATDNVGVASYQIERCQGAGCSSFAQVGATMAVTFNNTMLAVATGYSYRVRAADAAGNLGAYSPVASASTLADTQAPAAPAGLTATAASGTQVNLAWSAATDDIGVTGYQIERCAGAGCSAFAQIGTTTTALALPDAGLTPGAAYAYRVRATDAAGNLGGYSNVATVTTPAPDGQAPTAPSGLTATAASGSQINLAWSAATDNVAVTNYLVERCAGAGCASFAQVATTGALALANGGLTANTSYSYRARATDAAGNLGPYSGVATAVTPNAAPATPAFVQSNYADPQTPQAVVAVPFTSAQAAGDLNVVVVGWNDTTAQVASVVDGAGNAYVRAVGPTVMAGTLTQSMYYAKNIAAAAAGANTVTVTFTAAAVYPDIRILEYRNVDASDPVDGVVANQGTSLAPSSGALTTVNANDLLVAGNTVTTTTTAVGGGFTLRLLTEPDHDVVADRVVTSAGSYTATATLNNSGGWIMQMVAFKAAGSAPPAPDMQAPTAPSALTASAASGSQINLAWSAASDDVAVTGYLVERCQGAGCSAFAQIGTTGAATLAFGDTGLAAGTAYGYRVRATDAAGNLGPYSNVAAATTPAPDTQAPTAPSALAATAVSGSQINLAWSAASDNVAVTGYLVERCQGAGCASFAQVGTSATLGFASSGLTAGTTYGYRVRATDAAGNLGPYSNVASATTTSTPAVPAYVQGAYAVPQTPQALVTVAYPGAQSAGDLNVVVVGWNDSIAQVASITDSAGNSYALAVGPTVIAGTLSQSIYYAKNIAAAAANTVTVTFTAPAVFPDVRAVEYRNLDTADPFDVAVANQGNDSAATSGAVVTRNASDLLVAANTVTTSNAGAGSGFTLRLLTDPDGDIVEDRLVTAIGSYTATAPLNRAGAWLMQMVAFRAAGSAPPMPDNTPPVAAIASPAGGATLSGTVTVTVNASDVGTGVASVQLLVDNVPVGSPDTVSPYSFSLDTVQLTNDVHSIGAYALDFASNIGNAAPVSVVVSNNAAPNGAWSAPTSMPIVSVNVALVPGGKIFMYDGQSFGFDARVWDPSTNTFTSAPVPANIFCSGHEQMADGRILVVGGHNNGAHMGLSVANVFDPATGAWTVLPDMSFPRWYPTPVMLPNNRIMVVSGETNCDGCFVTTHELYDPTANSWSRMTGGQFSFSYYPHVYVLPDGRVFVPNTTETPTVSQVLDLGTQTWTAVGGPAVDGGASCMYRPGKFIKSGTSVDPDDPSRPSSANTYVIDMTQPSPTWRQVQSMAFARTYHTMTNLPDGTVLVTSGGPTTAATDTAHAHLAAELWNPATETWTTLASMSVPRLYHSVALLMPDGRVMVSGGGRFNDATLPTDQFSAQFFSPPYLFKGPRPVITSAPSALTYNQAFTVQTPDAARIASVALIRYGSVTHSINMSQRYVPLAFTAGSGSLTVTAPVNANLAPPGNYMLFIVDSNGVPSVAPTVRM